MGASPRASLALTQAARARAFLEGPGVSSRPRTSSPSPWTFFRHRVLTTYEAEAEELTSEDVIRDVLDTVPVP